MTEEATPTPPPEDGPQEMSWINLLVHEPYRPFEPQPGIQLCALCHTNVASDFHGPDQFLGNPQVQQVRVRYFVIYRDALEKEHSFQELLSRMGYQIQGSDLHQKRTEFVLEHILSLLLDPMNRLQLETLWAVELQKIYTDAHQKAEEQRARADLLVPSQPPSSRPSGLIVPGGGVNNTKKRR